MNTDKDHVTIYLQLIQIDAWEFVRFLLIYPIEFVFSNKTEELNVITGINELKTLTKDISCECKCKFDGRKCNSNQKWNKNILVQV